MITASSISGLCKYPDTYRHGRCKIETMINASRLSIENVREKYGDNMCSFGKLVRRGSVQGKQTDILAYVRRK